MFLSGGKPFMQSFNLITENASWYESDEAFSAITLNPTLKWMKFVLTDDKPNKNKQRVPKDEFANLIKSGINMPIKMAFGQIKEGHDDSFPIGVITHLKEIDDRIEGLAALWYRERENDIDFLKDLFGKGRTPQISWEIPYEESQIVDGIEELRGTALRAATIVGMPAYAGRTPIVALSADALSLITDKVTKEEEISEKDLEPFSEREREIITAIQTAKSSINKNEQEKRQMDELEKVQTELATAKDKIKELETELKEATDSKATLETENASLKEFKASVEAEKEKEQKLSDIREKFAEAKIEKNDEYFESNEELLLGLSESALDFMIQELVAFASAESDDEKEDPKESKSSRIPNFKAPKTTFTKEELAEALKARHTK